MKKHVSLPDENWIDLKHPTCEDETALSPDESGMLIEDAIDLLIRFYNRARALGWTTAEMQDAREFLRQYAPQEVW